MQRAAVRKLAQELGIRAEQLPLGGFHFLTRLHYCAPDSGTYGPDAPWGEHEVPPNSATLESSPPCLTASCYPSPCRHILHRSLGGHLSCA